MRSFQKTLYTVSAEFVVGIIVQKSPGTYTPGAFLFCTSMWDGFASVTAEC